MKVTVNQGRCCSSGQCAATAPEVFDQNEDDGLVQLRRDRPGPALRADTRLAAALCPVNAITVHEDEEQQA
jgi:ferredoxin